MPAEVRAELREAAGLDAVPERVAAADEGKPLVVRTTELVLDLSREFCNLRDAFTAFRDEMRDARATIPDDFVDQLVEALQKMPAPQVTVENHVEIPDHGSEIKIHRDKSGRIVGASVEPED